MAPPALHFITCPDTGTGHRMAWWQWGDPHSPHLVVCVHGLSRQGRDFDALARSLCAAAAARSQSVRVVCPDVAGRGESGWLPDPMGYQIPQYAADIALLVAHLHGQAPVSAFDWVGTSMGGLIGLVLAGSGLADSLPPLRRLVLNDVGPVIEWPSIQRIGSTLGKAGEFESLEQAADAMWAISRGFGPHSRDAWLALSQPMVRPVSSAPGARLRLHYDPAIALPFGQATEESTRKGQDALWALYERVRARTLLLRGSDSDLLSRETALAMAKRGPKAQIVEFEGVGHAPTLVDARQSAVVSDFIFSEHAGSAPAP
jgi:pimeloyl-ACP methyl ester carboxylesterase